MIYYLNYEQISDRDIRDGRRRRDRRHSSRVERRIRRLRRRRRARGSESGSGLLSRTRPLHRKNQGRIHARKSLANFAGRIVKEKFVGLKSNH